MAIQWGILGCGDVAQRRVAGAIQTAADSELVAVCRRDPSKLQAFSEAFGVERTYSDAASLLADSQLDAIYIATPVNLHCPQTIAAARAGKHVLVEKPMALSVAECDEMVAACEAANVRLGVAYYRRFYPVVARMKELISGGEIGVPLAVTAITSNPFRISENEDGYWRVLPEEGGGGALMDIGSHRIDLFTELFGPVKNVRACVRTVAAEYEADDCAILSCEFKSGQLGSLQCFFGTELECDEFSVMGTKGKISCSPLNAGELLIESSSGLRRERHPPHENFNVPLIEDFVAAIQTQQPPRISGALGRETNAVMDAAYALA